MPGEAVAVTVSNLTPTFWSVVGLTVIAIGALVKAWPLLDRQKRESDASLRGDLLKRIGELENDVRSERRHCEEELGKLRAQIEGLHRMIVQHQISTGRALDLSATPEAAKAMDRLIDRAINREAEQ